MYKQELEDVLDKAYDLAMLRSEARAEWKKLSRLVFKRDNFRCIRCEGHYELSAHHMMSREAGGFDSLANLVTLCKRCHDFVEDKGYTTRAAIIGSFPGDTENMKKETDSNPYSLYEGKPYSIDELKEIAQQLVNLPPELLERRLAYGWWPPYLAVRTPPLLTGSGQQV